MKPKWKQRKKKSVFTEKDNNTINAIVVSYNDKYNDIYNSVIDHYNDKNIEYYTDISQYIPYTIIIDMKSSVYMELLDIMQYTKLKLMVINKSEDSLKIILHGSLYDAIDTVKSVPNQMMNKLYRYILKSLYQYDKRFFTDLIELNILEELSFSNKIYNKDFNYDKDALIDNKVCVLCDTKNDYINILSNKYSISDIHQILNLSELTVMTIYPEPVLHRIGYDRDVESYRYIYSMSYYEWIQHLKLYSEDEISKSPLLKFVKHSLQESLGMSFNEIIALTIKPVSIARLYTYNSSFDPSIDEIIEDNID